MLRLPALVVLTLTLACGAPPTGADGGAGSCSCSGTVNGRALSLSCGAGECVSDVWYQCSASAMLTTGSRSCVREAWDATSSTSFSCESVTCGAGSYCAFQRGPAPRRGECRPIPSSCTPPANEDDYCSCLFTDAQQGSICGAGASGKGCDVGLPRTASISCL